MNLEIGKYGMDVLPTPRMSGVSKIMNSKADKVVEK